jgi:hypothetical protein
MTSAAAAVAAILDLVSFDFLTNVAVDWSSDLGTNYEFASLLYIPNFQHTAGGHLCHVLHCSCLKM